MHSGRAICESISGATAGCAQDVGKLWNGRLAAALFNGLEAYAAIPVPQSLRIESHVCVHPRFSTFFLGLLRFLGVHSRAKLPGVRIFFCCLWHTHSWVKSSSLGLPGVVRCLTPVPMRLWCLVCWTAFKVGCPCFVPLCGFYLFRVLSIFARGGVRCVCQL